MGVVIDVEAALAWCDRWFDPAASLLWNPEGSFDELSPPRTLHLVPQSGWYAAGLLSVRGDVVRAAAVFDRLCALQYDAPGTPWHGTFARFAESPEPRDGAVEWVDYDPNWRQFIGTTFALVLGGSVEAASSLPAATVSRMESAIASAIAGEPADRVPPTYSNIALMRAWLEVERGSASVSAAASAYAGSVVDAFDEFGAFEEYNSPTYYGIDLYALGLWARHSSSEALRSAGARIETAVWTDVGRWWHAGLSNLCGPWSRSYGMDMRRYAALLGVFVGGSAFPDLPAPFDHSHDTTFAPMAALVGGHSCVPADVRAVLSSFPGEHSVEQRVTADRVATGWLADRVMLGGEAGGPYPARGQYHPATVHWASPKGRAAGSGLGAAGGGVGWLRVRHDSPVDAVASAGRLVVEARGDGAATLVVGGDGGPLGVAVEVDGSVVSLAAPPDGGVGKARVEHARRIVVTALD